MGESRNYFHLHLVSDSTGETLMTVARAATVQYDTVEAVEHVYPLVRSQKQLDRAISKIEAAPGIVLYTLVDPEIAERLERACNKIGLPIVNVLSPVFTVFQSYLNVPLMGVVGGQHALDAEYFSRIEALNYTIMHDDGQVATSLEEADVVLIGVSRTSKTPTCIYLANRGIKAANVPIVPDLPIPDELFRLKKPLVVGLIATVERIQQIRQNRVLSLNAESFGETYIDRKEISREVTIARRLCREHNWPLIDVTRRSIEETAAEILALFRESQHASLTRFHES